MPTFLSDGIQRVAGAAIVVMVLTAGCATPPPASDKDAVADFKAINDPAEPTNRAIFQANLVLDTMLLKPASVAYKDFLPKPVKTHIHNFLNNLRSPVIFVNDLLQGDGERAGTTFVRFLINSTVGVLGLGDPASDLGYKFHDEDFGQTLAVWGMKEGPYVMLPIFGPSNPRDTVGMVVDFMMDPFSTWARQTDQRDLIVARAATDAVDWRARHFDALEELQKSALDYYAAIRSLYRQERDNDIRNGKPAPDQPAPSDQAPGVDDVPSVGN